MVTFSFILYSKLAEQFGVEHPVPVIFIDPVLKVGASRLDKKIQIALIDLSPPRWLLEGRNTD